MVLSLHSIFSFSQFFGQKHNAYCKEYFYGKNNMKIQIFVTIVSTIYGLKSQIQVVGISATSFSTNERRIATIQVLSNLIPMTNPDFHSSHPIDLVISCNMSNDAGFVLNFEKFILKIYYNWPIQNKLILSLHFLWKAKSNSGTRLIKVWVC